MKKILIVNNNLDIGGVQSSLKNLIQGLGGEYDISLLLFNQDKEQLSKIPDTVKIVERHSSYSILGKSKKQLTSKFQYFFKGMFVVLTKIFSASFAFKILGLFQRKIRGFDTVISFTHATNTKAFYGGCAEFVLHKTVAKEKICFIHCDYERSGTRCAYNDRLYKKFDKIACCSDSVKERFLSALPKLREKTFTVKNFYDLSILDKSMQCPYSYDESYINAVTVARLSVEKGIDRALEALVFSKRKDVRYYIVGEGPEREKIEELIQFLKLEEQVFLLGETENPYSYMKNADYLLVPSYHEAAPMVFDEAQVLELRIVSTETLSAKEMVTGEGSIVCANSTEGLTEAFLKLEKSFVKKEKIQADNSLPKRQFAELLQEDV